MRPFIRCLASLTIAASAVAAQALQVTSLTPQGEVAKVRQIVARFDQATVNFGDPQAPAPFSVTCSDAQAAVGSGRWTNEKEWVYDLQEDLPPGVSCTVKRNDSFKSPSGGAFTGRASYAFNTGGPSVVWTNPGENNEIEEQQTFVLHLNAPATPASLKANTWCVQEGVGERIPTVVLDEAQRVALLTQLSDNDSYRYPKKAWPSMVALTCNRTLTPGAPVQLVFGTGVATPSGLANTIEKRFDFTVRTPFEVSFSCERASAQAACLPLLPMRLSFSAPVAKKLADRIVLKGGGKTYAVSKDQNLGDDSVVSDVSIPAPLPEKTTFTVELPADFKDDSGRLLAAPDTFPLNVATGAMPPLAKFAASPFGVLERLAEPGGEAVMPVTVRRVEPELKVRALSLGLVPGTVADYQPQSDAEIIEWFGKLELFNDASVRREQARRLASSKLPPPIEGESKDDVQTRMVSLLQDQPGARTLDMPQAEGSEPRPFEVIGIALKPGFHVLEIASQKLGETLLAEAYGPSRTLYVRTSALATNLAVHFKLGRENSVAWVTTLDKGQVVAGARVKVSTCDGQEVASAVTDATGIARLTGISPQPPACSRQDFNRYGENRYFVSARAPSVDTGGADGKPFEDLAFTWSNWQRGIEPWRFNVSTSSEAAFDTVAHTILDRTLLRAGETVSMKHVMRDLTLGGFALPKNPPDRLEVEHSGSGQKFTQPIKWHRTPTGGLSAENTLALPPAAKLGIYEVRLTSKDGDSSRSFSTASFRVEEARLPVLEGTVTPSEKTPSIAATAVPIDVQINYISGGGAAGLPVKVSALVRDASPSFGDHDGFGFTPPSVESGQEPSSDEEVSADSSTRVVADKLPLVLDRNGAGKLVLDKLPSPTRPIDLSIEASFSDPNGEIQTIRGTQTMWPANVVVGIRAEDWVSVGKKLKFQALALDLGGKPLADVPIEVKSRAITTVSSRKRLVGGFYSYDNKTTTREQGVVCTGKSDARGLVECNSDMKEPGRVELVASAKDMQGRAAVAATAVYVTRENEIWFGGEDHDRIDVLPEKKEYEAGDVAKFQVKSPFRAATALVSIEREGIIETQVVQLEGRDPMVSVPVKAEWSPNVYVSVLALRGRIRQVPWYSFFTWGWKAPREWWTAFRYDGKEYVAPTALVDLSKPAYRIGVANIRVGAKAHRIAVQVASDQPVYQVRGNARVTITAKLPDGKPAANAEVALAVVDQALLELWPNGTWNLLDAMLKQRGWGVSTSTAQMEIVGRRHFGKKAVPAGGGGGGDKSVTRELFDTLLLWRPTVVLDANGEAEVAVPLNDSITTFRVVAIADSGTDKFGTGEARIKTTQDLQIISGLPPLIRQDDQFRAQFTLRNRTTKAMKIEATPRVTGLSLGPQTVDVPAGEAREVSWNVTAPAQRGATRLDALQWELDAKDAASGAHDAIKLRQRLVAAVPLAVQQATLVQLDGPLTLDVALPANALPGRGGLELALQPRLAEGLPGVRDWFATYPFVCLEQKASKSIGLRDPKLWQGVLAQLPTYLDKDGLASYFPPRDGDRDSGSDTLTSYLLAVTHEATGIDKAYAIADNVREQMENGLIAFVEGRIQRKFWSPRADLDVRKIAALEALSRYGKAQGRMLGSVTLAPNQWPTSAVIDWLNVLKRLKDVPRRAQRLEEANNILRARLSFQGTKAIFRTEQSDYWWWLMVNGDVNTARLMLAVIDDPAWKDDMGRLAIGFIGRQQNGAWHTTTANLWGGLALEKFSARFEAMPVTGTTTAQLGDAQRAVDWSQVERIKGSDPGGTQVANRFFGAPAAPGNLRNNDMFLAWGESHAPEPLTVTQTGTGKPWLTLQSIAAVPRTEPFAAGYSIKRSMTPIEQASPGTYTRGDIARITLQVNASTDMSWVVVSDPVPGGATILGSGLGHDSQIATQGEEHSGRAWPAFEERSFEAFRSYYQFMPKGISTLQYTVRLNNVGQFALPVTRVEAMYAPEVFGEAPNAPVVVQAVQ